jgi:transcriptional regulator with XRE-family HTH domain
MSGRRHPSRMCRRADPFDDRAIVVIGAWLRDWRIAFGISQHVLAKLSGVPQSHISRIENGLRRPAGVTLGRLLITLDHLSCGGPWRGVDRPLPSHAARWGRGRPPAIFGVEPLPLVVPLDAGNPRERVPPVEQLSPDPIAIGAEAVPGAA